MKFLFLVLMSLSLLSCATTTKREPTSEDPMDVSKGLNTDYFGTR